MCRAIKQLYMYVYLYDDDPLTTTHIARTCKYLFLILHAPEEGVYYIIPKWWWYIFC